MDQQKIVNIQTEEAEVMFFSMPEELRELFKKNKNKHDVLVWIIYNTNFSEEYKELKQFECYFSYSVLEEDIQITHKKLFNIMKQLEEEGYIEWIYKSNNRHKPSIIKNLASEKIALYQAETTTKAKKPKKPKEPKEINMDAEYIWELYPVKKGKTKALKSIDKLLKTYTKDELITCVERYKNSKTEFKNGDFTYMQHGSTFFNSGYEDYIGKNYQEPIEKNFKDKKQFDF